MRPNCSHITQLITNPQMRVVSSICADIPRPTAAKPTAEPGCLYRATFGKKKASAFVTAKDVPKFLPVYSSIIRSGMSALKRSKKAKKGAKKGEE